LHLWEKSKRKAWDDFTSDGKHIKKPKGTTKKSRRVFSRYDGIPMTIAAKQKVVGKKQFHDSHRKPFV